MVTSLLFLIFCFDGDLSLHQEDLGALRGKFCGVAQRRLTKLVAGVHIHVFLFKSSKILRAFSELSIKLSLT